MVTQIKCHCCLYRSIIIMVLVSFSTYSQILVENRENYIPHLHLTPPYERVTRINFAHMFNPLMGTMKQQNNGPFYSNTVIGTLAVDGWALTLILVQRGGAWVGCESAQSPPRCTKCNSPWPVYQFILFDVAL